MDTSLSEADFLTIVTYIKGELSNVLATASSVDGIKDYLANLVRYIEATEDSLDNAQLFPDTNADNKVEPLESLDEPPNKQNLLKRLAALFPGAGINKEPKKEAKEKDEPRSGATENNGAVDDDETEIEDNGGDDNNTDSAADTKPEPNTLPTDPAAVKAALEKVKAEIDQVIAGKNKDENELTCRGCSKTFETKEKFKDHLKTNRGRKRFKCCSCCKSFKHNVSLKLHKVEENHGFEQENSIDFLKFIQKLAVCPICNKRFLAQSNLDRHMLSHTGSKPFQCTVCHKQFKQKRSLLMHSERELHNQDINETLKNINPDINAAVKTALPGAVLEKLFRCMMCDRIYTTQNQLNSHMKVHARGSKHRCKHCTRYFMSDKALTKHIKKGCIGDVFPVQVKCSMCDETFYKKSLLDEHLSSHTKPGSKKERRSAARNGGAQIKLEPNNSNYTSDDPGGINALANQIADGMIGNEPITPELAKRSTDPSINPNIPAPRGRPRGRRPGGPGGPPYQCLYCPKIFARRKEWRNHQFLHTGEKPHKCDICGKTFRLRQVAQLHMNTHGGNKFKCDICNKSYPYKNQLVRHSYTHSGVRPYKCEHCGKGFISKPELGRHYGVHGLGKTFVCDICGKSYRDIKKHMLAVHSTRPTVPCPICHKGYCSKSNMKIHMLTHTATKTCICPLCGKGFTMNKYLSKHMILNHGEKKHKCQYCGKAFAFTQKLKMHERIHTGDKPYVCMYCGKRWADSGNYYKHLKIHRTSGNYASLGRKQNTAEKQQQQQQQPAIDNSNAMLSNNTFETAGNMDIMDMSHTLERTHNIERNHSMERTHNMERTSHTLERTSQTLERTSHTTMDAANMDRNHMMPDNTNAMTMERPVSIERPATMDSNSNMDSNNSMDRMGYFDRIGLMDRAMNIPVDTRATMVSMDSTIPSMANMERLGYMDRINLMDRAMNINLPATNMERAPTMDGRTGYMDRQATNMERLPRMDQMPNMGRGGYMDRIMNMDRTGNMEQPGIIDMTMNMDRMGHMSRILKF